MRVLVTGGAGFIGGNLCRDLTASGHHVRVLDDLSSGFLSNIDDLDLDFHQGTVTEMHTVRRCADGVDCIVHLAARGSVPRSVADPVSAHEINLIGTWNVLEVARRTGAHVVFSSSSSVYGANPRIPKNERDWISPMSPYAATKAAGESYVQSYSRAYGVPATIFRLFNVYGPGQRPAHEYAAVVPRWLWAQLNGEPISLYGDGSTTRDFTYISEVISVLSACVGRGITHPTPINLAFGRKTSLSELADAVQRVSGPAEIVTSSARINDITHSQSDGILIRELFPEVELSNLDQSIRETVEWLRRNEYMIRRESADETKTQQSGRI